MRHVFAPVLAVTLCTPALAIAEEPPPPPGAVAPPPPVAPMPPVVTPPAGAPQPPSPPPPHHHAPKKAWYERLSVGGYLQARYNRLGNDLGLWGKDNDKYQTPIGDPSVKTNNSFYVRRARLVVKGDVTDRVYFYLQGEFATTSGDALNFASLRDMYGDVHLDPKKEFRVRIGQSKVPFGFDNMMSSQHRGPLDRSDAINTAAPGERDTGVYFMWAPRAKRALLKRLVDDGLKGSGDYGIVTFGAYNGQSINQSEANNSRHVVARVTWPMELGSQIVEGSLQAYTGKFVVKHDPTGVATDESGWNFTDRRVAGTFVLYPRPIGLQAEYTLGEGPELRRGVVGVHALRGGYVVLNAKIGDFFPFVRVQHYHGARKHETNAPSSSVREVEPGIEWQADKAFELTASYAYGQRSLYVAKPVSTELVTGHFLRLQAQFNY